MKKDTITTPLIIAHRGYSARYPENTLRSFQAALDAGSRMIELDVKLSRDRKVIVIHDDTVDRTTDGHGAVRDYSLDDLRRLDSGAWFHPSFAGERIPMLEDVMNLMAGRIFINIEISPGAWEPHRPEDCIENQVMNLIREKKARDSVMISCFDQNVIEYISKFEDAPALAFLTHQAADQEILDLCIRCRAFSWHPDYRQLNGAQVDMMHQAGIRVFPFTVNSVEDYEMLLEMGVDGIFCDDPVEMEALNSAWQKEKLRSSCPSCFPISWNADPTNSD